MEKICRTPNSHHPPPLYSHCRKGDNLSMTIAISSKRRHFVQSLFKQYTPLGGKLVPR